MSDKIHIKNLQFFAHHGVFETEKQQGQRFILSITVFLDLYPAGLSDSWEKTVCYKSLIEFCLAVATHDRFATLEGLAHVLTERILSHFPLITKVNLYLEKPQAAIPAFFDSVAIDITRSRSM